MFCFEYLTTFYNGKDVIRLYYYSLVNNKNIINIIKIHKMRWFIYVCWKKLLWWIFEMVWIGYII